MKLKTLLRMIPLSLLSISLAGQACTSLAITDNNGDVYQGRTLELSENLPSWLTYYPEGTFFQKKGPDGKNSANYKSKYHILAITTNVYYDGDDHNVFQGLNSAGLSFSANMISSAHLTALKPSEYKESIPVTSIGEWALSSFSSVEEVANAVNNRSFWSPVLENLGGVVSPFHYAFYDNKGGSIVVEALDGKLHVYQNPTKVMTNGPSFPWHLENLNNYTQLDNLDRSSAKLGNIDVVQPDSGIASSDLPSSDTSVGRFIRAIYYTTYAPKANSPSDAMNILAHAMNRFDRLKNITTDSLNESGKRGIMSSEYTVWTSLSSLKEGIIKIRGYNDINYQTFSLAQFKQSDKPVFEKINVPNSN
ncbi:linear amide C-N hydrolase [Orbus sturtevantii]|uniref:linear amide C-N hydrolase n=1 Tax=Orbus sturtevantii TaxID=3074109 RepID=UPI00370DAE48